MIGKGWGQWKNSGTLLTFLMYWITTVGRPVDIGLPIIATFVVIIGNSIKWREKLSAN